MDFSASFKSEEFTEFIHGNFNDKLINKPVFKFLATKLEFKDSNSTDITPPLPQIIKGTRKNKTKNNHVANITTQFEIKIIYRNKNRYKYKYKHIFENYQAYKRLHKHKRFKLI